MKRGQTSPRRVRGSSPVTTHRSKPLVRPRRSKRGSSGYLTNNPWTDGVDHSDNGNPKYSTPQHSTLDMVPSHWTTESGKFDPRQSEMSFDARSNAAINLNMRHSRKNNRNTDEKSLDSEDTHGNSSEDSPKTTKKAKKKVVDGEIEDPTERHQFYKKLKKAGIKKTFVIRDDWETNSNNSAVSEISVGNASYILDLAQQKESRKKDREEEALEEALELYGTWLTEGKNDDKNIFLMILHEVKKEQKAKYKKLDKKHEALLNAALDDELKRREQVKQEGKEEEERAKAEEVKKKEAQAKIVHSPDRRKLVSRKKSFHTIQCETKISEIITSQQSMEEEEEEDQEKDSCDDSNDSDNLPLDWSEPSESPDSAGVGNDNHVDELLEPSKPKSSSSRHMRMLSHFGSKRNFATSSSSKSDHSRGSFHKQKSDLDRNSMHKESKGIFSRLRRQLSERQAEQWKEQETSWREFGHVVTAEEKWWNKINDAKQERVLFSHQKAMLDQTSSTLPATQIHGMAKLDVSRRTDPGNSSETSIPDTPAPKKAAQILDESHTSTTVSAKTNASADSEKNVAPKKKKATAKDLDSTESSNEQTPEKKKKTEKPSRSKHNRFNATSTMSTPDLDATKCPKPKDKKKKKKAKSLDSSGIEGVMALKDDDGPSNKMERYSRNEATDDDTRSVGSSKSSASTKSLKKKKSKGSKARNSLDMSSRKSKKKSKSVDSAEVQSVTKHGKKKKSKKKSHASVGSNSDDLCSDDASLDWTDRCISASPSDETGAETIVTSDSGFH